MLGRAGWRKVITLFLRDVGRVVRWDLRRRLTARWALVLGAWAVLVVLFTVVTDRKLTEYNVPPPYLNQDGVPRFGGLTLFVVLVLLLLSPALTARSVNGGRQWTSSTPPATRPSPAAIAVGKLLAGWMVGLAALALALPCVAWTLNKGGVGVSRAATVVAVTALLIAVVCAMSLALSALIVRPALSTLTAYIALVGLHILPLLAFGLLGLVSSSLGGSDGHPPQPACLLITPNPIILVADAMPPPPHREADPLEEIKRVAREACEQYSTYGEDARGLPNRGTPVWPYGLGFDLALGAGAIWIAIRRLGATALAATSSVTAR
jgi:ABC-type transport system involved in multi-copper enzyme maturation permease subunit